MRLFRVFNLLPLVLLTLTVSGGAQSTVVSGTAIGPDANHWGNASITAVFRPTPGLPGPFIWSGGDYNTHPAAITTDATGAFTITLPTNVGAITPAGSMWTFTVCPNATSICGSIDIPLSGGSMDISSTVNPILPPIQASPTPLTNAYADTEIKLQPGWGQLYYRTADLHTRQWNGTAWVDIGSGGCSTSGSTLNFLVGGNGLQCQPSGIQTDATTKTSILAYGIDNPGYAFNDTVYNLNTALANPTFPTFQNEAYSLLTGDNHNGNGARVSMTGHYLNVWSADAQVAPAFRVDCYNAATGDCINTEHVTTTSGSADGDQENGEDGKFTVTQKQDRWITILDGPPTFDPIATTNVLSAVHYEFDADGKALGNHELLYNSTVKLTAQWQAKVACDVNTGGGCVQTTNNAAVISALGISKWNVSHTYIPANTNRTTVTANTFNYTTVLVDGNAQALYTVGQAACYPGGNQSTQGQAEITHIYAIPDSSHLVIQSQLEHVNEAPFAVGGGCGYGIHSPNDTIQPFHIGDLGSFDVINVPILRHHTYFIIGTTPAGNIAYFGPDLPGLESKNTATALPVVDIPVTLSGTGVDNFVLSQFGNEYNTGPNNTLHQNPQSFPTITWLDASHNPVPGCTATGNLLYFQTNIGDGIRIYLAPMANSLPVSSHPGTMITTPFSVANGGISNSGSGTCGTVAFARPQAVFPNPIEIFPVMQNQSVTGNTPPSWQDPHIPVSVGDNIADFPAGSRISDETQDWVNNWDKKHYQEIGQWSTGIRGGKYFHNFTGLRPGDTAYMFGQTNAFGLMNSRVQLLNTLQAPTFMELNQDQSWWREIFSMAVPQGGEAANPGCIICLHYPGATINPGSPTIGNDANLRIFDLIKKPNGGEMLRVFPSLGYTIESAVPWSFLLNVGFAQGISSNSGNNNLTSNFLGCSNFGTSTKGLLGYFTFFDLQEDCFNHRNIGVTFSREGTPTTKDGVDFYDNGSTANGYHLGRNVGDNSLGAYSLYDNTTIWSYNTFDPQQNFAVGKNILAPSIQLQNNTFTCNATNRGRFDYIAGGAGVKDIVQVCAKDAADAYAFRTIY